MKTRKVLITGALGQIGSELTRALRQRYGKNQVIASNKTIDEKSSIPTEGPFEVLDVLDYDRFREIAKEYEIDTIIHLAALLSATAENNPQMAWKINMDGLINGLEIAREFDLMFFTPSSIGAFGHDTPKEDTPQVTVQRPSTMYGINKVSGELLCDYYSDKFNVDTRGVRFPGLISHMTAPGGGTTDYAIEIFHAAAKDLVYTCPLAENTCLDMMYMPDAIQAIIDLIESKRETLIHPNAFNISAMSFTPAVLFAEIKKHKPNFQIEYKPNPLLQKIADSWPDRLDYHCAVEEWGFHFDYGLEKMVKDMIYHIEKQYI